MRKVSLAMAAALVAAVITGVGVNAENDSGDAPGDAASAEGVVFVDGNRARSDPDYHVQWGEPTDDGTCLQDKGLHVTVGPWDGFPEEPTGRPAPLAHYVAIVTFEETDQACVFEVETHDYTGLEALLLHAFNSGSATAGDAAG